MPPASASAATTVPAPYSRRRMRRGITPPNAGFDNDVSHARPRGQEGQGGCPGRLSRGWGAGDVAECARVARAGWVVGITRRQRPWIRGAAAAEVEAEVAVACRSLRPDEKTRPMRSRVVDGAMTTARDFSAPGRQIHVPGRPPAAGFLAYWRCGAGARPAVRRVRDAR